MTLKSNYYYYNNDDDEEEVTTQHFTTLQYSTPSFLLLFSLSLFLFVLFLVLLFLFTCFSSWWEDILREFAQEVASWVVVCHHDPFAVLGLGFPDPELQTGVPNNLSEMTWNRIGSVAAILIHSNKRRLFG